MGISLSSHVEKRTLTMNPLTLVLCFAILLPQIASAFIVIESDYPEYDDYYASAFPLQQSQEIRQSGFSITSIKFVGTVFLASLFAFLVLPYFQQNSNTMARTAPETLPFILKAVSKNKFEN